LRRRDGEWQLSAALLDREVSRECARETVVAAVEQNVGPEAEARCQEDRTMRSVASALRAPGPENPPFLEVDDEPSGHTVR
jgi:hypothetical protein